MTRLNLVAPPKPMIETLFKSRRIRPDRGFMHHPGRRRSSIVLTVIGLFAAVVAGPLPAFAADFDPNTIIFPVVGDVTFIDDFGSPRSSGRTHEGTDIMSNGVKGLPVVAPADGVVGWIGSTCCYFEIDHGGGWTTWYIHLNNDTQGTDDGLGWGIADGLSTGTPVVAGQLIGWVGDSGNAEEAGPHLHFEIRKDGVAINAYPYLVTAPRLAAPGAAPISVGQFTDDNGSPHEADIEVMYALGVTYGCNPEGTLYCPHDMITRGQIAAFISRFFALAPAGTDYFGDDDGSIFNEDINAVMAAGIGFGCGPTNFCPDQPLLRDEMAEMLVRAFGVGPASQDYFYDDASSAYQPAINALFLAGITYGCDPDDAGLFCPDRPLTRAEMASFFVRSMNS